MDILAGFLVFKKLRDQKKEKTKEKKEKEKTKEKKEKEKAQEKKENTPEKKEKTPEKKEGFETKHGHENKEIGSSMHPISIFLWVGAVLLAVLVGCLSSYLSWTSNTVCGWNTSLKILYSIFAFMFGTNYICIYFVNRLDAILLLKKTSGRYKISNIQYSNVISKNKASNASLSQNKSSNASLVQNGPSNANRVITRNVPNSYKNAGFRI